MLNIQCHIYSVDTGNFYSNREANLHWLNHSLRVERNKLVEKSKEIEKQLKSFGFTDVQIHSVLNESFDDATLNDFGEHKEEISGLIDKYSYIKTLISEKNRKIKDSKEKLLTLLKNKVDENIRVDGKHHVRELKENKVSEKNIVSVFDSFLTRTIGAKQDEFTDDFMVVQIYYFDVMKDLIHFGFIYKNEKYVYFTSSAGQIRKKKCVFIKESVLKKHENTIMCGLTLDKINEKGGCNPNKYLAYLALTNSATDVWKEFDIDKTIVIKDFETKVHGTYDFIDDTDFSIKRTEGDVPITHTDGAGMVMPYAFDRVQRNMMVRLPWMKGLLGVFDFQKFIKANNCSPIIEDIYGVKHDVIAEDIQVVFTESQFKMHKYYDSWEQYKELYKKYGCTAGIANIEERYIKSATINYQMLQTLTDITDEEIKGISQKSVNRLNNICSSIENMKSVFGITPYNKHSTYLQKAINIYPDLMNDEYIKDIFRKIKNSMVKRYKSGSLEVDGKYTFVLPDFYAACEYWFNSIENPNGLLADKEVFCSVFQNDLKLDCLRSPHLYREHAVRYNVAAYNEEKRVENIKKWLTTNAVYTSTHDLISKILQFDCDGDTLLVIPDKAIVSVAERNMKNIVPLYYDMKKALPKAITNKVIYVNLIVAFTGGNIGMYSNDISKIWNNEIFITGTDEQKEYALNCIRRLCCQNNFVIDFAKTLYKPEFPDKIKGEISSFTNANVPYFFIYAKEKNDNQVSEKNNSFVNKLDNLIVNPRISYKRLGLNPIDYNLMLNNSDIQYKIAYLENGKIDKENTEPLILKFIELNREYHFKINITKEDIPRDMITKTQVKADLFLKRIALEIKNELSKFGYSDVQITDILTHYLYAENKNSQKNVLWLCYGDIIYENLRKNLKSNIKTIKCVDCGEEFDVSTKDRNSCRCADCRKLYRKKYHAEWVRKQKTII